MDEDKFMEWFNNNYDENAVKFAEKKEEEFEEYCLDLYSQSPDEDMIYDYYKEEFENDLMLQKLKNEEVRGGE